MLRVFQSNINPKFHLAIDNAKIMGQVRPSVNYSSQNSILCKYCVNPIYFNVHVCYILLQGRGGSYCELKVRVQEDRSILFESAKYANQHLTVTNSGKPGDPRGSADPSKQFYVYCKVRSTNGSLRKNITTLVIRKVFTETFA